MLFFLTNVTMLKSKRFQSFVWMRFLIFLTVTLKPPLVYVFPLASVCRCVNSCCSDLVPLLPDLWCWGDPGSWRGHPQDGSQLSGAHSRFFKLKMASFHCWPWISFPFLPIIRLLTQTSESIFLKSKTNLIKPLYSHRCRHTYHCLTPVCSLLQSTLKSVREPRPESLYPPTHWTRQEGFWVCGTLPLYWINYDKDHNFKRGVRRGAFFFSYVDCSEQFLPWTTVGGVIGSVRAELCGMVTRSIR